MNEVEVGKMAVRGLREVEKNLLGTTSHDHNGIFRLTIGRRADTVGRFTRFPSPFVQTNWE